MSFACSTTSLGRCALVAAGPGCSTTFPVNECSRLITSKAAPTRTAVARTAATTVRAPGERICDASRSSVMMTRTGLSHVVASAPQSREEFFDPGRLFVGRDLLGLDRVEQLGRKSRTVRGFLGRELRAPANDVELLAQRRARRFGRHRHQVVIAGPNSAEGHDD